MPTISAHISDELFEEVQAKVNAQYKGKRSPYLVDLIQADTSETIELPSKKNENMFVDLCTMLAGYDATERAEAAFKILEIDQRSFLEHVLKRATYAAKWLSEEPEEDYRELRFWHKRKGQPSTSSSSTSSSDTISKVI